MAQGSRDSVGKRFFIQKSTIEKHYGYINYIIDDREYFLPATTALNGDPAMVTLQYLMVIM